MKKYLAIALAAATALGSVAYAAGFKCTFCKGTGWQGGNGPFKCVHCGGDGVIGN